MPIETTSNIEQIKGRLLAVDNDFATTLGSIKQPTRDLIRDVCQKPWFDAVQSVLDTATSENTLPFDDIKSMLKEAYPESYISPMFTALLKSYDYQDFGYNISRSEFDHLLKSLRSKRSAPSIEKFIGTFKEGFQDDPSVQFYGFLTREFKPRHPSYYWLEKHSRKFENAFLIESDRVIRSIQTILHSPRLHSRQEVAFALAVAAGQDLTRTLKMTNVRLQSQHIVSFTISPSQTIQTKTVLCDSEDFVRAAEYIRHDPISAKAATNMGHGIPHKILGIEDFSNRWLPTLHDSLKCHFVETRGLPRQQPDSILASFAISGNPSIIQILKDLASTEVDKLKVATNSAPENIRIMFLRTQEHMNSNPLFTINVRSVREFLHTDALSARIICRMLDQIYRFDEASNGG